MEDATTCTVPIFQQPYNNSSLKFHCIELTEEENIEITKIVEENGGEMGESEAPIIFMPKKKFENVKQHLAFRVYDINFIKHCAQRKTLLDLWLYRLTKKKTDDRGIISLFLYGRACEKCFMKKHHGSSFVPDSAASSESETTVLNILTPSCIKQSQSFIETRATTPTKLGGQSQSCPDIRKTTTQESYHTAMDLVSPKSEPTDSQETEKVQTSPLRNDSDASEDENANLSPKLNNTTEHESEPWIPPCDSWMEKVEKSKNNKVYPTEEYIECNNVKAPLLRKIVIPASEEIASEPTVVGENVSGPSIRIDEGKQDTSTDEQSGKKTPTTIPRRTPPRNRINSASDDAEPGPSGVAQTSFHTIESDSDIEGIRASKKNRYLIRRSKRKLGTKRNSQSDKETDKEDEASASCSKNDGKVRQKRKLVNLAFDSGRHKSRTPSRDKSEARKKRAFRDPDLHSGSETECDEPINGSKTNTETADKTKSRRHKTNSDSDGHDPWIAPDGLHDSDSKSSVDEVKPRRSYTRKVAKKEKSALYMKEWKEKKGFVPSQTAIRLKFTKAEQRIMVKFLCSHENIERLQPKGLMIWETMRKKGLLSDRSAMSLQNHFVKVLLPRINTFFHLMNDNQRRFFTALQTGTTR